jgi:hypothetical protein
MRYPQRSTRSQKKIICGTSFRSSLRSFVLAWVRFSRYFNFFFRILNLNIIYRPCTRFSLPDQKPPKRFLGNATKREEGLTIVTPEAGKEEKDDSQMAKLQESVSNVKVSSKTSEWDFLPPPNPSVISNFKIRLIIDSSRVWIRHTSPGHLMHTIFFKMKRKFMSD